MSELNEGISLVCDRGRLFVTAIEKDHGRALRRYLAARMRMAAADVPDLVQEVFVRLLRVPDHETIRNPRAYLYTIASHVLHQHALARVVSAQHRSLNDIAEEPVAPVDSDPAETAQLEQKFEALGRGLEAYSPRAYAALMMYRCEGATLEQIGQRLGVSHVMARKYLMKATLYCQQQLNSKE